jgi:hypothetical protein
VLLHRFSLGILYLCSCVTLAHSWSRAKPFARNTIRPYGGA